MHIPLLKLSLIFAIGMGLLSGCFTAYTPGRVFLPSHTQAQQLEVQVSKSQSHIGYSLTDDFSLHLGGYYLSNISVDVEFESESTQYGGELGLHYRLHLGDQFWVTAGVSGAYELYEGEFSMRWFNRNSGRTVTQLELPSSTVIRPSGQLALQMFGGKIEKFRTMLSLFTRVHKPFFSSDELSAELNDPLWVDAGLHFSGNQSFGGSSSFGLYAQVLYMSWLTTQPDPIDTIEIYNISPISVFIGLNYMWDGSSKSSSDESSTSQSE